MIKMPINKELALQKTLRMMGFEREDNCYEYTYTDKNDDLIEIYVYFFDKHIEVEFLVNDNYEDSDTFDYTEIKDLMILICKYLEQ